MAITFSNIGMAEPSTITNRAAAVTIARGSTNEQQEILVIGDPESSVGLARVLAATPASTEYGLAVREIAPSTGPIQISSVGGTVAVSTGPVAVSSIAGRTLVDQNSTTWVAQISSVAGVVTVSTGPFAVSSIAGRTLVDQNSTTWVTQCSTLGGRVLVDQNSTVWPVQVSSVAGTVATAEVVPTDSTYASGEKASSGDTTIISSQAGLRIAVFGYHLSLASTTPTLVRLLNGSTTEMARWFFQGPSSVSIGANLAVSMPGYLYRTASANPLVLNTDSTATVHYSFQAYRM